MAAPAGVGQAGHKCPASVILRSISESIPTITREIRRDRATTRRKGARRQARCRRDPQTLAQLRRKADLEVTDHYTARDDAQVLKALSDRHLPAPARSCWRTTISPQRDSVRATLLRLAMMIGCLAVSLAFGSTLPARAQHPSTSGATFADLPAASHSAETRSLDGQHFPPGPLIVSQIHNAPGWQPSHTYTYATGPYTRAVSGPGWDPAKRSYDSGRTLDAYQLISPGSCTSSPGSGPSGTGPSIKDGTCTWKYLSNVDYISITGWAFDSRPWKRGTLYHFLDHVTSDSPLRTYALAADNCSSTVAPTGTGADARSMVVTGDGCHWQYQADIIYTSKRSFIPTETFTTVDGSATLMLQGSHEAQLWNDREYVAGRNGEVSPIRTQEHNDFRHEGGVILGCETAPCYHILITTAPGESFRDSLTQVDPLAGYDPSKGVAIHNNLPYRYPFDPAGFLVHDNYVDLIGLQIASVHGAAVEAMLSFGNVMTIRDCILDGGSNDPWTSHAAVTTDTSPVIANSLIISRTPIGVALKYPGFILHSTIVNPDHPPNSVGIVVGNNWVFNDSTVSNTAIFGFTHAASHLEVKTSWSPQSSNNMTDAPAGDAGTGPWAYGSPGTSMVDHLPGTTYGVSMASAFVKPGSDWRPSSTSPLRGAGSAFDTFSVNCEARYPSCPQRTTYNFDARNIIGTARPQAGRYDIGAW
jgi:hypothetical protein